MFRLIFFCCFMVLSLSACLRYQRVLEITGSEELLGIASASGLAAYRDSFFLVGDDTPFLFQTDSQFQLIRKWQIYPADTTVSRTPKDLKADFEALENIGDSILLVFGSGSKSPQRDIFIRINPDDPDAASTYTLTAFYSHLKNQKVLQGQELNIEGVTVRKNKLYLLNRTPAVIFEMDFNAFLLHITDGAPMPDIRSNSYQLPSINGTEAGFSGITSVSYIPYLIFTASVEATNNAFNDGAILGSFVGTILLKDDQLTSSIKTMKLDTGDKPVKVESIAVERIHSDRHLSVVLVTDSDGKESMIYRCRMNW